MKFKRIILKNFGKFQQPCCFDLDDKLTVFYGENFSGKTTLARAIYFALCGKVLTTGLKPKGIISSHESSATAGIIYSYSNATYRLYRSTKGDAQCEFLQGEHWQLLQKENGFLPPLNPQQWQIGCFLQEAEIGEFLTKMASTRRDLLNLVLGIEQLRAVQDGFIKVRRLAKRLEKDALSRQSGLRLNTMEDCSQELAACKNHVVLLEEKLRQAPEDNNSQQRLYQEWTQQQEELQTHLNKLTEEYHGLLSGFSNSEELHSTLQQVTERLTDRERFIQEADSRKEHRLFLAAQLQQYEELLAAIRGLHGQKICPTCQQPISQEHVQRLEADYQRQCDALHVSVKNAEAEEQEAHETLVLFEQLAGREHGLQQRVDKLEFLEKEITDIRKQLETVHTKLEAVTHEVSGTNDRASLKKDLEQARSRLNQLETQHALFEKQRQEIATINLHAAKATHQRLLSEWVADAVEQTMQAVIGTSLHQTETSVLNCLEEFQILQHRHQRLNLEGTRLMPDVNGRVFHALSGGEKVILYLAMKLAVSQLMPGADFIVLDNPTAHLDDIRRQQMQEYLLNLVSQKQVIVLTNDDIFADLLASGKRIELN